MNSYSFFNICMWPYVIKVSNILFLQGAFPVCAQMSMGTFKKKKTVALSTFYMLWLDNQRLILVWHMVHIFKVSDCFSCYFFFFREQSFSIFSLQSYFGLWLVFWLWEEQLMSLNIDLVDPATRFVLYAQCLYHCSVVKHLLFHSVIIMKSYYSKVFF